MFSLGLGEGYNMNQDPGCMSLHTAELHNYLQQCTFTTLTSLALRALKDKYIYISTHMCRIGFKLVFTIVHNDS